MTYKRLTYDEYEVQGLYYGQWELETTEATRKLAKQRLHEYKNNVPEIPVRIKKIQVKKTQDQLDHPEKYCPVCWCLLYQGETRLRCLSCESYLL